MNPLLIEELIVNFLNEDLGLGGDWSSLPLKGKRIQAILISKETGILCGSSFFEKVFKTLDPSASFRWERIEGEEVSKNQIVCTVEADGYALLGGERTALNLIQRLSGIATKTREYIEVLKGSHVKLLDTRKTTPGLRIFEKYATKVGGAYNHRINLSDALMIKDNHIKAFRSLKEAVKIVRKTAPATITLEVEVESWSQLEEALSVIEFIDIIMLDNWKDEDTEKAVNLIRAKGSSTKIEISGGITLEKLKQLKKLPIDFVSTSKIVTSATWIDFSLEVLD